MIVYKAASRIRLHSSFSRLCRAMTNALTLFIGYVLCKALPEC